MVLGNITEVKEKVFNKEKRFMDRKCYRPPLSHNIVNIVIGTTVSYIDDETKLGPLIHFANAWRDDNEDKTISNLCCILF